MDSKKQDKKSSFVYFDERWGVWVKKDGFVYTDYGIRIDSWHFPEVTFENSPMEFELVRKK